MSVTGQQPVPPRDQGLPGPPLAGRHDSGADLARETTNALGSYLRARREQVTPEQVGIPAHGVRRVPGLRREEVAMLAGISADYYLRLERGRDRHPSRQVIDAVARVLQLDDEHSEHLRMLAEGSPRASRRRPDGEIPPTSAVHLVDSLGQPAYIEGRYFDILASNPPARAFNPRLAVGGNQLRDLFLDPAERSLHREWDGAAICLVSSLRQEMGNDIDDPGYARLVGELSQESPRFRDLWARHEVGAQRGAPLRIDHPQLGELTVNRERLRISGADGLTLVVYSAEEGSAAAEKLALLASAAQPAASGTRW